MKRDNTLYRKELIKKLFKGGDLKREKELLSRLFSHSMLWFISRTDTNGISLLNEVVLCPNAKTSQKKACLACLKQVVKLAEKSRKLEHFVCPRHSVGLCLPLIQGDAVYGFLVLCHLQDRPSQSELFLFEALNTAILEKVQKELELSKLYQTIRPRAIALSTVHTINRLITSSLDLDELLPKIARLSLQVLRAKRCIISLVDKKTKRLVPKACIDLSRKNALMHVCAKIRRIENEVMRTGNVLLRKAYLSMPLVDEELIGAITIFDKINKKPFDHFDREILSALSEQAVGAIKNAQLYKEQENMLLGTVKSLSTLLKVKSAFPYTHSKAFVDIVIGIAKEMKLSEEERRNLRFAAMLHDAGKIGIPVEILKKPAQLSGKEFDIVKKQPQKTVEILSPLERLKPAIAIILHHHEKFDGTGYPDQLKGEKIPVGARIMAVADSFEAMVSRRPYRKSTSVEEAIEEIKRHSGSQFDPRAIEAFLKFVKTHTFKSLIKGAYHG